MLKALELSGFKSFADKTRFEFPPGITVVVGPNGSGKSNIVDAVKWVLGEQSAKSLRGKDMADVIFKGSGGSAGGRKPLNTAEATIVIDNAEGRIPIDAPEVHVTRRVYRSGEGEYLINRQPCRLKDIKDLFRGTGVGSDAYSMIEQGKVDQLLQASAKDRRAIFEEAAGISRFKAKKIECQRRLERVDQNLLRLSDIVEEVESRLRSVRAQASKARRYKEYTDRLQQLRTQVGLVDWRKLSEQLEAIRVESERLRDEAGQAVARVEALEARSLELEVEIGDAGEAIRACEGRISANRERIAGHESSIAHQRSRCRDLKEEELRHREQLAARSTRAGDLQQRLRETVSLLETAETAHEKIRGETTEHEHALADIEQQLERLRQDNEARRLQYVESMRRSATLGNQLSACQSQLEAAQSTAQRCRTQLDELEQQCGDLSQRLTAAREEEHRLASVVEEKNAALEAAQRKLNEARQELAQSKESLAQMQARWSGASQRAQVLEDLESKLEGLDAGVKEVLTHARNDPSGPFGEIRGLVADLIQADVQSAPLIDVALGERAHHVVVADGRLVQHLESDSFRITGRVGFIRQDTVQSQSLPQTDLSAEPGVVQRADQLVQVSLDYQPLARYLLGGTWVVGKLSDAVALSQGIGKGQRFVTLSGQLLDSDGSILVGSQHQVTGIVSRRSQLRALREEIERLDVQIAQAREQVQLQQSTIETLEQTERALAADYKQATAKLGDARLQAQSAQERFDQANKQFQTVSAEQRAAETQQSALGGELDSIHGRLMELDASVAQLESAIEAEEQQIDALEAKRHERSKSVTASKIELAKSEQTLVGLKSRLAQFEEDQRERARAILESRNQLEQCRNRHDEAERSILRMTTEIAELFLRKEKLAQEAASLVEHRRQLNEERTSTGSEIQRHRRTLKKLEEQQHQAELSAGEVQHQRNSLAERLREDYGIELAELTHEETEEELHEREAVEEEIATLRRKINNIGAVNMEALAELEELEVRFAALSGQHQDLTQAKNALEGIIQKINADSRRLFSETLEAIRTNFQALFRKAFGGGRADIILEEGVDILEAGIEIIATPPGKPQFNNSLLSGGEKALTAVALLLAIFQYRPSPFCVLDEVDAPFDEANIGRFIDVLREFLGWTKFVIVTHSKKTMTAATTLYGVTMQESGVSKQVSVRFDDVSDDGHISREAIERQEAEDAA